MCLFSFYSLIGSIADVSTLAHGDGRKRGTRQSAANTVPSLLTNKQTKEEKQNCCPPPHCARVCMGGCMMIIWLLSLSERGMRGATLPAPLLLFARAGVLDCGNGPYLILFFFLLLIPPYASLRSLYSLSSTRPLPLHLRCKQSCCFA